MSRKTSFDELYTSIGAVITKATGRSWWRQSGIQTQPIGPYSLIYITEGAGVQNPVTELSYNDPIPDSGEVFTETPWGTMLLEIKVSFFRSATNDKALQAATRFANSLRLEERFWDLWEICGLVGGTRIIDVSSVFRQDTEPRAEVRFQVYANVADPAPLNDTQMFDIDTESVTVIHVRQDDMETETVVAVQNDFNDESL